jgi:predicted dehydrogenase
MDEKLKTVIVGLGPHGIRILQSVLQNESLKLVGVVDRDEKKLNQEVLLKTGAIRSNNLSDIWTSNIEFLLIATNGPSHINIATEAIKNGVKYLLISKPMTTSIADAIAINDLAKQNNVRIGVDHILRYDDTYQWIKSQVVNKTWGELRRLYIQRPGIGLGCLGVHSFDLANFLTDLNPKNVTGWLDVPIGKNPRGEHFVDPGGLVIIDYGNGVRATIDQIEDGSGPAITELVFNHARVRVDEKNNILEVVEKDSTFVPGPNKKAPLNRNINPHLQEVKHDMIQLLGKMINELISQKAIISDGLTGQNTIEILVAAYISNDSGNIPVSVPISDVEVLNRKLNIT